MSGIYAKGPKGRADRLFSQIVRARGVCQVPDCGETRYALLQCCHIYSRTYNNTRTDETNALCMCASHHAKFTARPLDFGDFVRSLLGDEEVDALRAKAHAVGSWSKNRWTDEADRLAAVLAEIIEGEAA
jgi:hypothetical protein